jgi:hypothetical protein
MGDGIPSMLAFTIFNVDSIPCLHRYMLVCKQWYAIISALPELFWYKYINPNILKIHRCMPPPFSYFLRPERPYIIQHSRNNEDKYIPEYPESSESLMIIKGHQSCPCNLYRSPYSNMPVRCEICKRRS